MGKIFPYRKLNPTKGRADIPDAPPIPHTPKEDMAAWRELVKEEQAKLLARRAAAARNRERKANRPLQTHYAFYFEPELAMAFKMARHATFEIDYRELDQRNGPNPNRYLAAAYDWLKHVFMKQAPCTCAKCGIDITSKKRGRVPHEMLATGPLNGPYKIQGICLDCIVVHESDDAMVSYIKDSRIVCKRINPEGNNESLS